ncbi:MAG: hypothetical protein Q4F21_11665 [Lachnospiraceae bacterium]|nr:hypothetical protein [Lachnospiraceae bacterium]
MYRFQEVDFQNIRLQDRPGGWLAGDFPFDADSFAAQEEIRTFLLENPVVMLEMATNLFYNRELEIPMTKVFYVMEKEKQNSAVLTCMNSIFERMSAWYEMDEESGKYLLVQGEGISESCIEVFESMRDNNELAPMMERLYMKSHFCNDVTSSGYYYLASDMERDFEESGKTSDGEASDPAAKTGKLEKDSEFFRQLFQNPDFRQYGSINVSGLSMQELTKEPFLEELQKLTDQVYLYIFDLCLKCSGEKSKKYVNILRWNAKEEVSQ